MGAETGISWASAGFPRPGSTWNVTEGCSRTAAEGATTSGCGDGSGGGCYAERDAGRFCGPGLPYEGLVRITPKGARWTGTVRLRADRLRQPLQWRSPRGIFTCSTSDPYHEALTDAELDQWVAVAGMAGKLRGHTIITLTKRAERMRSYLSDSNNIDTDHPLGPLSLRLARAARAIDPLAFDKVGGYDFHWHPRRWPWFWQGVSAEHQLAADERIPLLLEADLAVRVVSCEPLIGEVDLDMLRCEGCGGTADCSTEPGAQPTCGECDIELSTGHWLNANRGLDWVIAGCESGPRSRPTKVAWLRQLRDQCANSGTAFFLKQATGIVRDGVGGSRHMVPIASVRDGSFGAITAGDGSRTKQRGVVELPYLDGVQHAAFPEPMETM